MKAVNRITMGQILTMIDALKQQAMTYDGLADLAGLSKEAATRWVKNTRAEADKRIYIADWLPAKDGTLRVRAYRWGPFDDAPRPGPRLTNAERMRLVRASRKAGVK